MLCSYCKKACGFKQVARENPRTGAIGLYPTDKSDCCGAALKAPRVQPPRFMGSERR